MESTDDGALRARLARLIEDFLQPFPAAVHLAARDALAAGGDPAVAALMDAYPTLRSDTRWDAAYVLYAIGTPQATAALVQLLDDPDADVRTNAAGWLVSLNDPAAIAAAVPILLADLNEDTIRHLGHAGDIQAVEPLIAALEALPLDTTTYARRMSLASALGRLGDPRAIPVLERLVQTDTVPLDAWGTGVTVSVAEAAQTALDAIAARTAGRRPTPDVAEPPADGGA